MDIERLRHVLGRPEMAWLVQRLRRRLEAGQGADGTLSLRQPTAEEREAHERLFGHVTRAGSSLRVSVPELQRVLHDAGICHDLRDALEALGGPLREAGLRQKQAARWAGLRQALAAEHPELAPFLGTRRGRRVLRAAWTPGLGAMLTRLATMLPRQGTTLAELAAMATGDSHGLDRGRPAGVLALRLAAVRAGLDGAAPVLDRRLVWASVGVLCDELSAPALVLNLLATGDGFADEELRRHRAAGEPYRISVRQLLRQPPRLACPTVFVCENPSVLAAASDALGAGCPPLVCTEGQPRSAVHLMLQGLSRCGTQLRYHGDFDWPGIRIGNLVVDRYGAIAWRFGTEAYREAAVDATLSLSGPVAEAGWDAALAPAMQAMGRAVHEEQVMGVLLRDLGG